ncbi:MAG: NifB/NifX family molybdenum-iron cluster-binding protein [Rikenellaceae bacterium]
MIKIAIPTRGSVVDDHFGHCEFYSIYTIGDDKKILEQKTMPSPQGCGCKSNIASILQTDGVQVMLAGSMGQGALEKLSMHGIKVFRGCNGEVTAVLNDFLAGKITDSGIGCTSHGDGSDGHVCSHNK